MRSRSSAEGVWPNKGPASIACLCTSAELKRRARSASVLTQFVSTNVAKLRGSGAACSAEAAAAASVARRILAMMTACGSHPATDPAPITRRLEVTGSSRNAASASAPILFSFTNMVVRSVPSSTCTDSAKAFSLTWFSRLTESSCRSAMLELPTVPPPTRSSVGHLSPRAAWQALRRLYGPRAFGTRNGRMSSGKQRTKACLNFRVS
mmetsp:Transcript_14730/g.30878  ORF Transcript_14730/g.30878 Transcript_14730/m.30878 type:complete len:208 (-) Transcript_14730:791-1414(-)